MSGSTTKATILIGLSYLAVASAAAIDAHRRGRSGLGVGLAVLIVPFFGAIWWVAIRSRYPVEE